jgi:hypothetical protein
MHTEWVNNINNMISIILPLIIIYMYYHLTYNKIMKCRINSILYVKKTSLHKIIIL